MAHPIVRVTEITKTFGGSVKALDGVTLQCDAGIIYGRLGPNGAGKTTLIRILTTLLRPDAGSAEVAGVDILADPRTARTKIGLAGQFAAVDGYQTGRENVEMVGRLYGLSIAEAKRRADEVLERIRLTDAADRQVKTYSGGMQRRLDLAASLVGRPEVLFLDEPTTGIDPRSRLDVWELISDLVDGGTTVLLTTQYLDEADQLADRVAVIDEGRLISEGTTDDLKDRIGGSVIEVSVPAEHEAETMRALERICGSEPSIHELTREITVAAPAGAGTLTEVVRALDAASIVPNDLALHKPSLDDVFLTLTGHTTEGRTTEPNGSRGRRRRSRR